MWPGLGGFGTRPQPGLPRQLVVPSINRWREMEGARYQHHKETNSTAFTARTFPHHSSAPPKTPPSLARDSDQQMMGARRDCKESPSSSSPGPSLKDQRGTLGDLGASFEAPKTNASPVPSVPSMLWLDSADPPQHSFSGEPETKKAPCAPPPQGCLVSTGEPGRTGEGFPGKRQGLAAPSPPRHPQLLLAL